MKTIILLSLLVAASIANAQSTKSLSDSTFALKYMSRRVWIDPRYNSSILTLSALKPEPISIPAPPRYTLLTVTAINFDDSSTRPLVITCKGNGRNYIFKIGRADFEELFTTSEPRFGKKWSKKIWKAIDDGTVIIGMTKEQARLSWGEPSDINTTTTRGSETEQWVYGESYLYFRNGILDAIQNWHKSAAIHQKTKLIIAQAFVSMMTQPLPFPTRIFEAAYGSCSYTGTDPKPLIPPHLVPLHPASANSQTLLSPEARDQ